MIKQLSCAVALVFAVACKTDPPAPSAPGATPEGPAGKVRSAKIDVKPVEPAKPALPDEPRAGDPAARQAWRDRRNARLDSDGDGVVSDAERAAAMHDRVVNLHARLDADGDGKLTPAELGNARGRMRFDDPAALDTNHDGDISADELAAGLKARRDQRRGARGSADPTAP
jgi:hypothetical protein